jgi:hypothetical protein
VRDPTSVNSFPEQWLVVILWVLLEISATEWQHYCKALRGTGILLRNMVDTLVWTGGDSSGVISVKNIYKAIINSLDYPFDSGWIQNLWKWQIQLKINYSCGWLRTIKSSLGIRFRKKAGKVRGCASFVTVNEDIDHLLIHCSFTKAVWSCLYEFYHLKIKWDGITVTDCFNIWSKDKTTPTSLAALACWHIWNERNKTLFEERSPSHLCSGAHDFGSFSWRPSTLKFFQTEL